MGKGSTGKMILSILCGIFLTIIGILVIVYQPLFSFMVRRMNKELALTETSISYSVWTRPVTLTFTFFLFNVTNPDEVMRGESPNLAEYGPFVYNQVLEKQVVNVDKERDEITYTTKSTFSLDKERSYVVPRGEKVTILNPAYIGSIIMLSQLPGSFLEQHGNNIPKLFPNQKSIFITGKATDILFKGYKITCNPKKYPELALVCQTLKGKPPKILKPTDKEGVYLLSLFSKMNDSVSEPSVMYRGLHDINKLGILTEYKGERIQSAWSTEECNRIHGSDSVVWAPFTEPPPFLSTFIGDICRTVEADFVEEVIIKGLKGMRYAMGERMWAADVIDCFCPIVNEKKMCLPKGLLDIYSCDGAPTIISEPHFLHGDPSLLEYARGLSPVENLHQTYLIIDPLTGTPLSGQKRSQVNLKLSRQPVNLLNNVSEGYFPLAWFENGHTPNLQLLTFTIQTHRLKRLIRFLQLIPLIVGVYIILMTLFLYGIPTRKVQTFNPIVESVLISSSLRNSNLSRRPIRRSTRMFE